MEYLVLVEKKSGKVCYYLFSSEGEARQYRADVTMARGVKAAWLYREEGFAERAEAKAAEEEETYSCCGAPYNEEHGQYCARCS